MNVEVLEDCEIIDDPTAQETAEVFLSSRASFDRRGLRCGGRCL